MMTGFSIPQVRCPNFLNAKYIPRNYFSYMDIFNCEGVTDLDPYATVA